MLRSLFRRGLVTAAVAAAVVWLAPATAQANPARSIAPHDAPRGVYLPAMSNISPLAVADVDRDGDVDLVALADERTWHVWLNLGDGTFQHTSVSVDAATLWGPELPYVAGFRSSGRSVSARIEIPARASDALVHAAPALTPLAARPSAAAPSAGTLETGSPRAPPSSVR
jgi:hypothetical protein